MAEKQSSDAARKELNKELKAGCPAQAYLLYGDEPYLIHNYARRVCSCIGDLSDSMNSAVYRGTGIDIASLISIADTLPFFKERRLILIENSGFFGSSCDRLADYLKNPCSTTAFVFVEYGLDKRTSVKSNTRMFKTVSSLGKCIKLDPMDEESLKNWVASFLDKRGRKIRSETVDRLFKRSGTDMNQLCQEMEKLVCYTEGSDSIEDADIDAICTYTLKEKIFDMTQALTEKDPKRAFSLYYDMLALKTEPIYILRMIAREYHILLRTKELTKTIRGSYQLANALKLRVSVAETYARTCRLYTTDFLKMALDECLALDKAVKSGLLAKELSVELFISKYSK